MTRGFLRSYIGTLMTQSAMGSCQSRTGLDISTSILRQSSHELGLRFGVGRGAVLKGAPLWQKWAILFATYVQTLLVVSGGKAVWGGCPWQIDGLVLTQSDIQHGRCRSVKTAAEHVQQMHSNPSISIRRLLVAFFGPESKSVAHDSWTLEDNCSSSPRRCEWKQQRISAVLLPATASAAATATTSATAVAPASAAATSTTTTTTTDLQKRQSLSFDY